MSSPRKRGPIHRSAPDLSWVPAFAGMTPVQGTHRTHNGLSSPHVPHRTPARPVADPAPASRAGVGSIARRGARYLDPDALSRYRDAAGPRRRDRWRAGARLRAEARLHAAAADVFDR